MSSPIEQYLGQLRAKLESRFDSECATQLLSEIRGHLFDSAAELEEDGVPRAEAESLSVQRFGAPEKAAFLLPLGQQFGTGDRYWGWGAFVLATAAAVGVAGYCFLDSAQRALPKDSIPTLLTAVLLFYAYACWRARSFSMLRQSAAAVALIVMVTGLFGAKHTASLPTSFVRTAPKYYAQANMPFDSLSLPSSLIADLGVPSMSDSSSVEFPNLFEQGKEKSELKVPGMAPIGQNPWALTHEGLLPEASRILLSWLFLVLMANAAVCWVGCLEHEQKGGVALIQ